MSQSFATVWYLKGTRGAVGNGRFPVDWTGGVACLYGDLAQRRRPDCVKGVKSRDIFQAHT